MKIKGLAVGLSLMAALALNVSAIEISYSTYGIGSWTPGNEFNNDNSVMAGVNHTVDIWNGTELPGSYTLGKNTADFAKGNPSSVSGILPLATAYEDRDSSPTIDNRAGQFLYLTVKYGNDQQQVFYIGGLKDIIELPGTIGQGGGFSHVSVLRGATVPDGGLTAMLLGFALAGVTSVRRYFNS